MKGYVVSDLHLLARHSAAEKRMPEIETALAGADLFVFNGDTFDFRWAEGGLREAIDHAVSWLEDLAMEHPHCQFHLVLGNHDYEQLFIDSVNRLQNRRANFHWHRFHLQVGDKVFLHGDLQEGASDPQSLARRRRRAQRHYGANRFFLALYPRLVPLGVQRIGGLLQSPRKSADRLMRFLAQTEIEDLHTIHDIYFGHTHRPLTNFRHNGRAFHNTGSAVKSMGFNMQTFEVPAPAQPSVAVE